MGEDVRVFSIRPCGTSTVLLQAVKTYDMGPSRFTSQEGVLRIFIALTGFERTKFWVQWQVQ
jgi:hypothetical protein